MDEYSTDDLISVMLVKNNLICLDGEGLIGRLDSEDAFGFFIDSVNVLLDTEASFLLLDNSYLEKISDVVNKYRFTYRNKEFIPVVNEIIYKINEIKNYPEELIDVMKYSYVETQCQLRSYNFSSLETFVSSMSYDAVCVLAFTEGQKEILSEENEVLFYCSSNYLMNMIPDIYEESYAEEISNEIINKRLRKVNPLERNVKSFARDTQEAIQKIKRKA